MGVTVAIAVPLEEVRAYTEMDVYRAELKQISLEEVAISSGNIVACSVVDTHILPEDFDSSLLLNEVRKNLVDYGMYQLIMFLIDSDLEASEDLEVIAGDIMLGMIEGDLGSIDHKLVAIYVFEYNNK